MWDLPTRRPIGAPLTHPGAIGGLAFDPTGRHFLTSSTDGLVLLWDVPETPVPLGASRTRVFFKVVVPIAFPGVMSAALFAFLASFDELVISLFLAGARAQTLPVRIWNSLHLEIEPVVAAAATFLIGVTGIVLLVDGGIRRLRGSLTRKTET